MDARKLTSITTTCLLALTALTFEARSQESPPEPTSVNTPSSSLHFSQLVAVAAFPLGLLSDSRLEVRAPMHRSSSMVFQDTYAAVGGRGVITPAFASIGPRMTLAPIDFFDVVVMANATVVWPSDSGLIPYDHILESTIESDRKDMFAYPAPGREVLPGGGFDVRVQPTLKLKVGPVIAFSSWDFSWIWLNQPDGEAGPYVYEPFRDRIIEWDDVVVEHQSAVVGEILPGQGGPLLWVGATYHDVWALGSRDRSIQVGPIVVLKPSYKAGWPRIILQVKPYVMDHDRVGGAPRIALALTWDVDRPLGEAGD
jgi:hypothetical protein